MPFTLITVTANELRPDGQPASGTFTATLSEVITNGTQVLDPTPISGVITAGAAKNSSTLQPFTLEANDDTATTPAGSTYSFVLKLDAAPVEQFDAVVSHSAPGGTVDLSALRG